MSVIVRNCPSPTGDLHIGTLRTALYNYLYAKKHGGKILYRSEDTDKERSTLAFEENIFDGLVNVGMIEKETVIYRQSEQTSKYRKYLEQLIAEEKAYYCFMTADELNAEREEQKRNKLPTRYSGEFRDYPADEAQKRVDEGEKYVIRIKVPKETDIVFTDLVRGDNKTNTRELADFVIAKNLDSPLYNFVVVIDDHEMGVTHVMRGEDHIPNTPKQLIVYEMFAWTPPHFAHFPLILNADKSKLSKRKNKTSVQDYLDEGYLKEAILNFLILLGWNDGTEKEIFTLDEMVESFSLDRVHKGGAVYDMKKLDWLNGMYLRNLSLETLTERVTPFLSDTIKKYREEKGEELFQKILAAVQGKLKKLSEINELVLFFYEFTPASTELVCNPKMKVSEEVAKLAINGSKEVLSSIDEADFTEDNLKEKLIVKIKELKLKNGQLLWPLRAVLTGVEASPGAFEVAVILGKTESLKRLDSFNV